MVGLVRQRVLTFPVGVVWALFLVVAVEIVITYARLPPSELYHVSGSGLAAGFGRALVFLNFPVALAALPLAVLVADQLRENRIAFVIAIVGAGLCAVVFWPGVVDQANLDARAINVLPAVGAGITFVLAGAVGVFALPARVDVVLGVILIGLVVLAFPWIAADLGFFLDRVPLLGSLFLSGKVVGGHPAVHHGHHHGMDGFLLVVAALATIPSLRRARSPMLAAVVTVYLGLEIAYGLANLANDAWLEQVVKRGWTSVEIPSVLRPAVSLPWFGIVLATPFFAAVVRRRAASRVL
jgi:hypothetical protein